MRSFSADYIFPVSSEPIKNGVVTIDDEGTITGVFDPASEKELPSSEIECHQGIICPGFINTHCHLELSHLRGQISEHGGMTGFITDFISKRTAFPDEVILQAIADSEAEMIRNGIVAVADISNNSSTFRQKAKGNLLYHTFIEIFNSNPEKAKEVFETGKKLQDELKNITLLCTDLQNPTQQRYNLVPNSNFRISTSIVPHAPYTLSEALLTLINEEAKKQKSIISIHNQESEGENHLFEKQAGVMYEAFTKMGIDPKYMRHTQKRSLQSTLPFIKDAAKILLVHNTFTSKEDIQFAKSVVKESETELYWCTCPNANLYIENKLPDYNTFTRENACMTIGTDSLASNHSLSVLDELKTISKHFPDITLQTLLTWATRNGAQLLGLANFGSIEKGKKPGLNLLKNTDDSRITEHTALVKLA